LTITKRKEKKERKGVLVASENPDMGEKKRKRRYARDFWNTLYKKERKGKEKLFPNHGKG